MAKKVTATSDNQTQEQPTESTENKTKAGGPPSGFYIYIGPNIAGLIRSNAIYRGDRKSVLAQLQKAIEKYPLIKTLIISGDSLPSARLKLKTAGNALHANYAKLVEQVRADYAKNK